MPNNKGSSQEKQTVRKPSREEERAGQEALSENGLVGPAYLNVGSPGELPAHSTARSLRQAAVLQLQQLHGNHYVQRVLATGASNGSIRSQSERELQLSAEGLGLDEELEGHPSGGIMPYIQRDGEEESGEGDAEESAPTVNISLTANEPTITRPSQAAIEARHGANIAGWTTPRDTILVPSKTDTSITITITLNFRIKLAREYTGDRLAVLQDHENHHPTIARNVAQEYLVDNLRTALEALPDFRDGAPIQAAIQSAHNDFVSNEGTEARAFDTADYSRMEEAYYGVRTPLADLASATAAVQTMVTAIDSFNSGATAEPEAAEGEEESAEEANSTRIIALAQPVIDARAGLAQVDVDRLQYNMEFKGKVTTAGGHVTTLGGTSLNEAAQTKLQELQTTLNGFTWTPA
ncbi:MAG: hypothetical protein WA996_11135 [Candidatus Promineifilaceae bacterium]